MIDMPEISRQQFAGFWIRFVAYVVDQIFVLLPLSIAVGFASGLAFPEAFYDSRHVSEYTPIEGELLSLFASLAIHGIYFTLMESSNWQATVGKRMMRIKVVDYNGQKLNKEQAFSRWFNSVFSHLTLGYGYIMIGLTEKRQGLHDKIAKTLVLRMNDQS